MRLALLRLSRPAGWLTLMDSAVHPEAILWTMSVGNAAMP